MSSTGTPRPLPPGLDVAAYRIVQEALTNVLKHAGPTNARVQVRYADPVLLEITDDGPAGAGRPASTGSGGHGLLGMRERAALFGGRLETGRLGHGFRVQAWLPLSDPSAPPSVSAIDTPSPLSDADSPKAEAPAAVGSGPDAGIPDLGSRTSGGSK